ncbi:NAD(P)/FAD-dependent oxidoreductase [Halanaeroarchaeum sulfurireducens]|uniref:Thioredoxin-disulfide reductase n=1 Tax=Halanaeroarchaeum sulfurireducens TaxID=1604004 RepID=A0A0F7PC58_9EURY|nr:FAD-dependent oxidoreductase [Halanaeroarchaeum sulfurireducens]AKH97750.1 thioredoxin-disulfide reductase [Halanaeroarchaeum sulfurireducens]ALG82145.1 thioredoxin-disulfide reductase [Halanaeroarchaeum sulfurireducens]
MSEEIHDVVIVGSGVAGHSAAIYAARADFEPVVYTGEDPGGQLTLTTDVENFLGFPDGVSGTELVQNGRKQAESFGARYEHRTIVDADLSERPFTLELNNGDTVTTRGLIIATGASARWVGAENEDAMMGYGLSTCATCDGAFHRGNDVLVVGGGDSAMEEALFLTKFAETVYIVHRREELRASEIMARRAEENEDIEFLWNTELVAIEGSRDEGVQGAKLVRHPEGHPTERMENGEGVEEIDFDCSGIFYAIGHTPNTEFLEDTPIALDEDGYIETESGMTTETGIEGVFAAGDVMDRDYQQAITAAGTGSMAALDLEEWLDAQEESATAETAPAAAD